MIARSSTLAAKLAVAVIASLAVAGIASASVAHAGFETFMGAQGLSAGNAYASTSAHSFVNRIEADVDHTACPSVAAGYGGYTSTPFSGGHNTFYIPCGYTSFGVIPRWDPNPTGDFFHGAVYNPNSVTFDNFNFAVYYWL